MEFENRLGIGDDDGISAIRRRPVPKSLKEFASSLSSLLKCSANSYELVHGPSLRKPAYVDYLSRSVTRDTSRGDRYQCRFAISSFGRNGFATATSVSIWWPSEKPTAPKVASQRKKMDEKCGL